MQRNILGIFEIIDFPDFGINSVKAKIDTGAYSGAFHCTKIKEVDTPDGKELHFSPFDSPQCDIRTKEYTSKHVKSSNGVKQERYFIITKVNIAGKNYQTMLSLADRTSMKWPVLIGRRFLSNYNFLVDVNK
ncbi:MAG TPA: RimK/LysX family protein [Candidatus Dormibacteraeota bacterium]|nr:RimK/LysX family protein [Candidatus Dormibacteraeota bacterium]